MTKSLQIECPNCSSSQWIAEDKVPDSGAWGRCSVCRERVFISRDNLPPPTEHVPPSSPQVEEPTLPSSPQQPVAEPVRQAYSPPEMQPAGAELPTAVFVKTPDGQSTQLSLRDLRERVRSQQILPWDWLSVDGRNFEAAQKHEGIAELFIGLSTEASKRCWKHTDETPAKVCARCQRCYCLECIPPAEKSQDSLFLCLACGGILHEADPSLREKPYWKRLDEVLRYPIDQPALYLTLGLGVILWIAGLSIVTIPLSLASVVATVYVLRHSAKGHRKLTFVPSAFNAPELIERSLMALLVTGAVAVPFILVNAFLPFGIAAVLSFFLGLAAYTYYPMALGTAVISDKPFKAFDPASFVRQVFAMGESHLNLLIGLIVVSVLIFATQFALRFIPLVGDFLASLLAAFGTVLGAHMIGWTFYVNLGRLGWRKAPVV